jgi:hypothetical protein
MQSAEELAQRERARIGVDRGGLFERGLRFFQ